MSILSECFFYFFLTEVASCDMKVLSLMLFSVLSKEKFYSRGFALVSISCHDSEFRAGLLASVLTFSCT